jgi:hypothetical protein
VRDSRRGRRRRAAASRLKVEPGRRRARGSNQVRGESLGLACWEEEDGARSGQVRSGSDTASETTFVSFSFRNRARIVQ